MRLGLPEPRHHSSVQNLLHDGAARAGDQAEDPAPPGPPHPADRGGESRVRAGHVSGLHTDGLHGARGGGLHLKQEQCGQDLRL